MSAANFPKSTSASNLLSKPSNFAFNVASFSPLKMNNFGALRWRYVVVVELTGTLEVTVNGACDNLTCVPCNPLTAARRFVSPFCKIHGRLSVGK